MARALQLARRGLYTTRPNPRVGCVLVRDGEVIGEGWHEFAGGPHAEINALTHAGQAAKGAVCYVTLEPCSHTGKTPPCTDALIAAGVSKVIASMSDPNPRVAGGGFTTLNDAGIKTESGLLENPSRSLNLGFIKRMTHQLPYVRCKLAMSLDGRTAAANGDSKWISGAAAREDVQRLRARSCAVMTGIGTVLTDDPRLNVRLTGLDGMQPLRVVLDRQLRFPVTARMLNQPGRILIFTLNDDTDLVNALTDKGAEVILIQEKTETFSKAVLTYLAREERVNEVLLEAGANLSGNFLQDGLIDEVIVYQAPVILGNEAKGLFNLPMLNSMDDRINMNLVDIRHIGDDLRLTLNIRAGIIE